MVPVAKVTVASGTDNTSVGRFPALRFQILADLQDHLFVFWMRHLLVHPKIVARLVIRSDWERFGRLSTVERKMLRTLLIQLLQPCLRGRMRHIGWLHFQICRNPMRVVVLDVSLEALEVTAGPISTPVIVDNIPSNQIGNKPPRRQFSERIGVFRLRIYKTRTETGHETHLINWLAGAAIQFQVLRRLFVACRDP
ncbi:hypothetical protein KC354_g78 [Hortaea werneckii]|nr:hypothetical protein KC354_g78 [Hortaea werneckii]